MYLKVLKSGEVLEAQNGNKYQVITFQELSEFATLPGLGTIEVKSNAKPASRTIWEGQDGLFANLKENDVTFGNIKRWDVENYTFTGNDGTERTVNSFTGVQFRGESDETTCRRYNRTLRNTTVPVTEEAKANAEVIGEKVDARQIPA